MTIEDQSGLPPIEVMRQILDENRILVRLISTSTTDHEAGGGVTEANALISAYREVMRLLEILSATSDLGSPANSQSSASHQEFGGDGERPQGSELRGRWTVT